MRESLVKFQVETIKNVLRPLQQEFIEPFFSNSDNNSQTNYWRNLWRNSGPNSWSKFKLIRIIFFFFLNVNHSAITVLAQRNKVCHLFPQKTQEWGATKGYAYDDTLYLSKVVPQLGGKFLFPLKKKAIFPGTTCAFLTDTCSPSPAHMPSRMPLTFNQDLLINDKSCFASSTNRQGSCWLGETCKKKE